MGEGDGVEEIEHKVDPIVYTNPSTETINISFSEADQVDESSQFYCDNPQLLNMLTETENIQVPLAGSFDSNYKYWDSDITAPLNLNKNILPPLHSATSMLTLPSNSKMIIEGTIKLKRIIASYKVVFTDENDENPIEIEGKWVGIFSNGANIKFTIKDI